MTDKEKKELGLSDRQRALYEYYENHPEELKGLTEALQPAMEALAEIYIKLSEALKPIIDALIPTIEAMADEDLIYDEEDSNDS